MHSPLLCRVAALVVAGCLAAPLPSAAQVPLTSDVQARLNAIAENLFSTMPRPAEAVDALKTMLAAHPGFAEAHMLLGIAYRAQASPDLLSEAVAELRQALALKPSLLLARLTLARVYLDMARASRAREELLDGLEESPGRPELLSLLGEAERQLGNHRRAAELNRQALDADPDFVQARYYLGLALIEQRLYAEAIAELRQVVESGANPAEAHLALGTAYLEGGRTKEALGALQEAARLDPLRPEIHIRLARAHRTAKQLAQADKALGLAAQHVKGELGALYHDLESDLHMEEGLLRMAQGRLDAAAAAFERVLALNANHQAARQRLADIRKRQQQQPPARKP